ncbi:MAG: hypothetical protein ACUVTL_05635 [Thermoproteota archaeon]
MSTIRQFIEVALISILGSGLTVSGVFWKQYDLSTIGVLLLVVGAILFFVRGPRYFNESLLSMGTLSCLKNMNDVLDSLDVKGKSLILPPQTSSTNFAQILVVGAEMSRMLENPLSANPSAQNFFAVLDTEGGKVLRLMPLGNDLAISMVSQLGEEKHQTITQMFQRVEDILVDMGAVTALDVVQEGSLAKVVADGILSPFSCQELSKYPRICSQLLCPICSALACLVSYFFQCPVAVEGASFAGSKTELSLRVLEEES